MVIESKTQNTASRRKTRFWLILAAVVVAIFLFVTRVAIPFFETGGGAMHTRDVPGDPDNFDPIAAFPAVQEYAGENALFVEMRANYVRADGTMELTASYRPRPSVTYEFVQEVPRPDDAPPVGAGGANTGPWYQRVIVEVENPGQWYSVTSGSSEYSYKNRGMSRETRSPSTMAYQEAVPPPTCDLATFWEVAQHEDAPMDAVAIITYDADSYTFVISGLSIYLEFDRDCNLIEDN
jgi:hypothetical protein